VTKPEADDTFASKEELRAGITTAGKAAVRLRGTAYYGNAHAYINELLNDLVGR